MTNGQAEKYEECSEIHTIQIFREAPDSDVNYVKQTVMTPVPYFQGELPCTNNDQTSLADEIGGDWAIEMDEDIMEEQASLLLQPPDLQGSQSSLYSFYFETPIVTTTQEQIPLQQFNELEPSNTTEYTPWKTPSTEIFKKK